jgi:hypothetical protein
MISLSGANKELTSTLPSPMQGRSFLRAVRLSLESPTSQTLLGDPANISADLRGEIAVRAGPPVWE